MMMSFNNIGILAISLKHSEISMLFLLKHTSHGKRTYTTIPIKRVVMKSNLRVNFASNNSKFPCKCIAS